MAAQNCWRLKSWDRMAIPKPFSRALARFSAPIHVPAAATDSELRHFHAQLQDALDRVKKFAETNLIV